MAKQGDLELLRRASLACLDNSRALFEDAQLLFDHGRYARTVSLAVLGREELGKAVIFATAAAGRLEKLAPELLRVSWSNPAKSHELKQHISEIASIANALTEDYLNAMAEEVPEAGGWNYADWFWEFVDQIESWAEEEGLAQAKGNSLKTRIRAIPRDFRQAVERVLPPALREPPRRSAQEKKDLGFYVDVVGNEILQPSEVSRAAAREMLIRSELDPIDRRLLLALADLVDAEG